MCTIVIIKEKINIKTLTDLGQRNFFLRKYRRSL